MSIQHYIKCEMCDTKHEIVFLYKSAVWRELPIEWLILFTGDANPDGWHFCSDKCLVQWVTGNVTQDTWKHMVEEVRRQTGHGSNV